MKKIFIKYAKKKDEFPQNRIYAFAAIDKCIEKNENIQLKNVEIINAYIFVGNELEPLKDEEGKLKHSKIIAWNYSDSNDPEDLLEFADYHSRDFNLIQYDGFSFFDSKIKCMK